MEKESPQTPSQSQEKQTEINIQKKMLISDQELSRERIPLAARDYCAHLLVSLNRCYRKNLYLPFRCKEEKHGYEECQYNDFLERVKILQNSKDNDNDSVE